MSNNLKNVRIKRGIKAIDIAKALNVSKQTISNWENGKRFPDIKTLIKLADFYNVSVDYLVGRTDDDLDFIKIMENIPSEKRKTLLDVWKFLDFIN